MVLRYSRQRRLVFEVVSDKKGGYQKPPSLKEDNRYKTQIIIISKGSEPAKKEVKSRARWVLLYTFLTRPGPTKDKTLQICRDKSTQKVTIHS